MIAIGLKPKSNIVFKNNFINQKRVWKPENHRALEEKDNCNIDSKAEIFLTKVHLK